MKYKGTFLEDGVEILSKIGPMAISIAVLFATCQYNSLQLKHQEMEATNDSIMQKISATEIGFKYLSSDDPSSIVLGYKIFEIIGDSSLADLLYSARNSPKDYKYLNSVEDTSRRKKLDSINKIINEAKIKLQLSRYDSLEVALNLIKNETDLHDTIQNTFIDLIVSKSDSSSLKLIIDYFLRGYDPGINLRSYYKHVLSNHTIKNENYEENRPSAISHVIDPIYQHALLFFFNDNNLVNASYHGLADLPMAYSPMNPMRYTTDFFENSYLYKKIEERRSGR